jgi:hypothetical protein
VIDAFRTHRQLWLAGVEAFLQAERSAVVREQLALGNRDARRGLSAWLLGIREDQVDDATALMLPIAACEPGKPATTT